MPIKNINKTFIFAALFIIIVSALGVIRVAHYIQSPDVLFLVNRSGAQWIKYDSPFDLAAQQAGRTECGFKYSFHVNDPVSDAQITVQSLKIFQVYFDGVKIFSSGDRFEKWKDAYDVDMPFEISSGAHEILIIVQSENSHPAVIAFSDTLPVKTGEGWSASKDGKNWSAAVSASLIRQPEISRNYPSSWEALAAIKLYLAVIFMMTFGISLLSGFAGDKIKNILKEFSSPSRVRWLLLLFWAALSINNMFKLNFQVGVDGWGHIDYIDYIVTKGSLPLASEGWQTFQAPLNYILSAPLYALLIKWFDLSSVIKIMSVIPVICGLLQIEVVYRVARLIFAEKQHLQIIAIITGALLPVHTYICQYVGNEPLAGLLISIQILLLLSLIMPGQQKRGTGYFVLIGFVWGLALLSKMTALFLAPVVILVLLYNSRLLQIPLKSAIKPMMITFGISLIIAGWYYMRNYIEFGDPFVRILDYTGLLPWWQDPSYRTWSQILSFGHSFVYPLYSGVASFGDTVYSTLWLDGFNSGIIDFMPWNENFLIAGQLLALLPSIFILTSVLLLLRNNDVIQRNAIIFSMGALLLFLTAMFDRFLNCSFYSVARSIHTSGLLPCYAILVAAGAEPFLRNKVIRSVALALFACWAFAAYAAYFVVKFQ
jgi:hypothetical protein